MTASNISKTMAKSLSKGSSSEASHHAATSKDTSKPTTLGSENIKDAIAAARSQLFQRLKDENAKSLDEAITKLKDEQQLGLERIQRYCDQDLYVKWKAASMTQIRQEVQRSTKPDYHKAFQDEVTAKIRDSVLNAVRIEIAKATASEQSTRANADNKLAESIETCQKRIGDLEESGKQGDKVVADSLAAIAKATDTGIASLQASMAEQVAQIERDLISRLDEVQEALALQVDTMTVVLNELAQMRNELHQTSQARLETVVKQDWISEDLMTFEENELVDVQPQCAVPREENYALDIAKFTELSLLDQTVDSDIASIFANQVGMPEHQSSQHACLATYIVDDEGTTYRHFLAPKPHIVWG